jgi:hypothetical protein
LGEITSLPFGTPFGRDFSLLAWEFSSGEYPLVVQNEEWTNGRKVFIRRIN